MWGGVASHVQKEKEEIKCRATIQIVMERRVVGDVENVVNEDVVDFKVRMEGQDHKGSKEFVVNVAKMARLVAMEHVVNEVVWATKVRKQTCQTL